MPTVDGFKVPDAITEQWRRELAHADDALLLAFAKSHPALAKGARLTRAGLSLIRKRLTSCTTVKGELDETIRDLLAETGLNLAMVAVLSEEALELGFDPLSAIYGYERLLAAMLVDHREGVREQAIDLLKQKETPDKMSLPEALAVAEKRFGRFLSAMDEWTAAYDEEEVDADFVEWSDSGTEKDEGPLAMSSRALAKEVEQLREQLAEARQKRAGEKALQKKIDKLLAKIETLETDSAKLRAERDERDADIRQLTQELGHAEQQTAELRHEVDELVQARIQEELDSIKRTWFRDARELDAAWREQRDGVDDALAAADAALARQAEADRHSGNLREMRERLEKLHAARTALQQAATEALSPLPEVVGAAEKVAREIDRIEALLPTPTPERSPLAAELEARVVAARSEDELTRLAARIDELVELALLPSAEGRAVYAKLDRAMGKRYDRFMPKVVAAPGGQPTDPVCVLRSAVAGENPAVLLVDGHNVLFALPDLFGEGFDAKGVPGAAAREALLERLRLFAAPPSRCDVRLYFDGPTRSEQSDSINLTTIFSGGGRSDQRADRVIVEYLEFCASNRSAVPRVLVTDDRELAARAREQGARTVSAIRFGALLEEMGS